MRLVDRDYMIFREVERWRYCLGRHIKMLAGFSNQRSCDRRLRVLLDNGFLERKKVIYGIPSIYTLPYKAKILIGANKRQDKIRLDNIVHDIAVLDTVIYMIAEYDISLSDIQSEKELHSIDGFSIRKHQPDFVFTKDNKKYCVEVELTLKAKNRLEKNINSNFLSYDIQIWILEDNPKLIRLLKKHQLQYPNIEIKEIKEVRNYVRNNY